MKIHPFLLLLVTVMVLCSFPRDIEAFFELSSEFDLEETAWSEASSSRKIDETCACGIHHHSNASQPPWNVFLKIQTDPNSQSTTTCLGTIITSNLIATSHECFLYPNRHLNIYDIWKPTEADRNAVWDLSQVNISKTLNSASGLPPIEVEEIIYHPDYVFASSAKVFPPRFDLALLRIKGFNPTAAQHPICIPTYERMLEVWKSKELDNREAYYYGYTSATGDRPDRQYGALKDEKDEECKKRLGHKYEMKYNFCYRYAAISAGTPNATGGPLYVESEGSNTSFLIGIASFIPNTDDSGINYDFFTNLIPLIKYIDYQAEKHNSTWCKKPTLSFAARMEEVGIERGDATIRDPYPWEMEELSVDRNESLDCVCGIPNKQIGGRVVGGVEATPHEFTWMSFEKIYLSGRGKGYGQCGGTVINDRMILSAAHCVVLEDKLEKKDDHPTVDPDLVDISLKLHSKHGDEQEVKKKVSAVLFHPEYAYGRTHGNYWDYDIALFVLEEPVTFDMNPVTGFRPICLPKKGPYRDLVGKTVTVAGWGLTDPLDRHSAAEDLMMLDVPIIDRKKCAEVATTKVTDRNICAGSLNRYKDAAQGDSGGPLMLKNEGTNQYEEVGIVSWGEDVNIGGEVKTAALYADVQQLVSFIEYHANRVNANWCKSEPPTKTPKTTDNPGSTP